MAYSLILLENLTELKTRRGNSTSTTIASILGLNYPSMEAFAFYVWNDTSTATGDDVEVIHPTVGGGLPGRWFHVDIGLTLALILGTLGYIPYDASNPDGYINIELDPTVPSYAKTLTSFLAIKAMTDPLYEPVFSKNTAFNKNFGTATGTVAEGNDTRIVNGATAFSWGNHAGLYPLLSGSYTNPSWIVSLPYTKITGTPILATVATSGSYTDLINKPTIPAALTPGTGISIVSNVVTNTAPDQTVSIASGNRISATGTYPNFTVAFVEPTINTAVVRTLNSNFTVSATKQANVIYSVTCQVTNPLIAGNSTATAFLEYSTNGGSTWNLLSQNGNQSAVGVAVAIAITNTQTVVLAGTIPANALVRIRTTTSGTASVTYVTGTEIY